MTDNLQNKCIFGNCIRLKGSLIRKWPFLANNINPWKAHNFNSKLPQAD